MSKGHETRRFFKSTGAFAAVFDAHVQVSACIQPEEHRHALARVARVDDTDGRGNGRDVACAFAARVVLSTGIVPPKGVVLFAGVGFAAGVGFPAGVASPAVVPRVVVLPARLRPGWGTGRK